MPVSSDNAVCASPRASRASVSLCATNPGVPTRIIPLSGKLRPAARPLISMRRGMGARGTRRCSAGLTGACHIIRSDSRNCQTLCRKYRAALLPHSGPGILKAIPLSNSSFAPTLPFSGAPEWVSSVSGACAWPESPRAESSRESPPSGPGFRRGKRSGLQLRTGLPAGSGRPPESPACPGNVP